MRDDRRIDARAHDEACSCASSCIDLCGLGYRADPHEQVAPRSEDLNGLERDRRSKSDLGDGKPAARERVADDIRVPVIGERDNGNDSSRHESGKVHDGHPYAILATTFALIFTNVKHDGSSSAHERPCAARGKAQFHGPTLCPDPPPHACT